MSKVHINQIQTEKIQTENINRLENIQPVKYGPIKITENSNDGFKFISYTDCFEISLLRFLHILFGRNEKMDLKRLKKFTGYNEELYLYFLINQNYSNNSDYYETAEGNTVRSNWCIFLNNRNIFKYKKEGKYEVCASFDNLINFIYYFLPNIKIPNKDSINFEEYLNYVFRQVNYNFRYKFLSYQRIDDEIYHNSKIIICFNKKKIYEWDIYQYFYKDTYVRRTGHSDFRYYKYLEFA